MFWCLVRLSTGALCGGLYASPLEMAIQSAVACSEVKDDGLLVSRQLMERVLVWVVSFSLAVDDDDDTAVYRFESDHDDDQDDRNDNNDDDDDTAVYGLTVGWWRPVPSPPSPRYRFLL